MSALNQTRHASAHGRSVSHKASIRRIFENCPYMVAHVTILGSEGERILGTGFASRSWLKFDSKIRSCYSMSPHTVMTRDRMFMQNA